MSKKSCFNAGYVKTGPTIFERYGFDGEPKVKVEAVALELGEVGEVRAFLLWSSLDTSLVVVEVLGHGISVDLSRQRRQLTP